MGGSLLGGTDELSDFGGQSRGTARAGPKLKVCAALVMLISFAGFGLISVALWDTRAKLDSLQSSTLLAHGELSESTDDDVKSILALFKELNLTSTKARAKLDDVEVEVEQQLIRTDTATESLIQNVARLNESGTAALTRAKKALEKLVRANAERTNSSIDTVEQELRGINVSSNTAALKKTLDDSIAAAAALEHKVDQLNESGTAALTRAKKTLDDRAAALGSQVQLIDINITSSVAAREKLEQMVRANAKSANSSIEAVEQELQAMKSAKIKSIQILSQKLGPSGCASKKLGDCLERDLMGHCLDGGLPKGSLLTLTVEELFTTTLVCGVHGWGPLGLCRIDGCDPLPPEPQTCCTLALLKKLNATGEDIDPLPMAPEPEPEPEPEPPVAPQRRLDPRFAANVTLYHI
jgi:hypothetical protein